MDGDSKRKSRKKRRGKGGPHKERTYARICALQALYQLESIQAWEFASDLQENLKLLLCDLLAEYPALSPIDIESAIAEFQAAKATAEIATDDEDDLKEDDTILVMPDDEDTMEVQEIVLGDDSQNAWLATKLQNSFDYMVKLVEGVCAEHDTIDDWIVKAATNWRLERMGRLDRCLIRLGAYEMMRCDNVTPAIVINEAVELAKLFGQAESPRFVNGVLDKLKVIAGKESENA